MKSIEAFGYGKGYTYLEEEFGKLLDLLEDVLHAGHNVVMTAHAKLSNLSSPMKWAEGQPSSSDYEDIQTGGSADPRMVRRCRRSPITRPSW